MAAPGLGGARALAPGALAHWALGVCVGGGLRLCPASLWGAACKMSSEWTHQAKYSLYVALQPGWPCPWGLKAPPCAGLTNSAQPLGEPGHSSSQSLLPMRPRPHASWGLLGPGVGLGPWGRRSWEMCRGARQLES